MPCTQQPPIGFIVLREVMRNGRICRSPVQQLHALVNHRAVHCIRLAVKISMNFTRIDFNVPFLASYRHSVDSGITAFCCVHTYRRCRAGSISRHGQTCSRLVLSFCVPTVLSISSTGISTCYPSTTALALALGPVSYTHLDVYKRQIKKEPPP